MMYAISSTILIVCLSLSLGALIRILSDQVHDFCNHQGDNRKKNSNESSDEPIKKLLMLETWKSQYLFIQRLIEQLNDVFDCILLIVISSTFVRLINNAFMMATPSVYPYYTWNQWAIFYSSVIQDVAILLLLAYVSHRLKDEVWI